MLKNRQKNRRFPPSYKGCNSPVADVKPNLLNILYLSKKMLSKQNNISRNAKQAFHHVSRKATSAGRSRQLLLGDCRTLPYKIDMTFSVAFTLTSLSSPSVVSKESGSLLFSGGFDAPHSGQVQMSYFTVIRVDSSVILFPQLSQVMKRSIVILLSLCSRLSCICRIVFRRAVQHILPHSLWGLPQVFALRSLRPLLSILCFL